MRNGRSIVLILSALAAIWWLLADQMLSSWLVGLPAIAVAGWAGWQLRSSFKPCFSWPAFLRFIPLFFRESVQGGTTVAWRVLSPRLMICPKLVDYPMVLQQPVARVFFIICVNLLPGTLVARHRGDALTVHLLDCSDDPEQGMRTLEQAVAAIFREPCNEEVCG